MLSDVSASPMLGSAVKLMDPGKRIDGLEPGCKVHFRLLLCGLALIGYGRVRVVSGRRSLHDQEVLFGQGRDETECRVVGVDPGFAKPLQPVVSWCRPSESKHVQGMAIDVDFGMYRKIAWWAIGNLVEQLNMGWGGTWSVKDYGHFEL